MENSTRFNPITDIKEYTHEDLAHASYDILRGICSDKCIPLSRTGTTQRKSIDELKESIVEGIPSEYLLSRKLYVHRFDGAVEDLTSYSLAELFDMSVTKLRSKLASKGVPSKIVDAMKKGELVMELHRIIYADNDCEDYTLTELYNLSINELRGISQSRGMLAFTGEENIGKVRMVIELRKLDNSDDDCAGYPIEELSEMSVMRLRYIAGNNRIPIKENGVMKKKGTLILDIHGLDEMCDLGKHWTIEELFERTNDDIQYMAKENGLSITRGGIPKNKGLLVIELNQLFKSSV